MAQPIHVLYLKGSIIDAVSTNQTVAVVNQPTLVNEGPEGGGLRFRGDSRQSLVIQPNGQIYGSVSLSMIISVDAQQNGTSYVLNNITQAFQGIGIICRNRTFSPIFGDGTQWQLQSGELNFELEPDCFHHIGLFFGDSVQLLYINGKLVKEANAVGFVAQSQREMVIGSLNKLDKFFSGCIEDFRIYKGELTAMQMQELASPVTKIQNAILQQNRGKCELMQIVNQQLDYQKVGFDFQLKDVQESVSNSNQQILEFVQKNSGSQSTILQNLLNQQSQIAERLQIFQKQSQEDHKAIVQRINGLEMKFLAQQEDMKSQNEVLSEILKLLSGGQ